IVTTGRIAGLWEGPGCGRRWGSGHDEAMIRWLRPRGGVGEPPVQVMAQTLARHFDAAHVDGSTVRLGFADLTVRCQVGPVGRLGSFSPCRCTSGCPGARSVRGLFILDPPHERTVEVKVSGPDGAPAASVFATGDPEPPGGVSLLRGLAVLAPLP